MGAGVGFEPTDLRGNAVQKAQWDAQIAVELLRVVEAWPTIRPELRAAIKAIVEAAT